MSAFNKFNCFVEDAMHGKHDFSSDTLKIMLSNTAPNAADAVKTDITEISAGNGYPAGGMEVENIVSGQAGGTYKLAGDDAVITATGGSIGPYRYAVLYNEDAPSQELIGWWDRGSPFTAQEGANVTIDLDDSNGIFQLT